MQNKLTVEYEKDMWVVKKNDVIHSIHTRKEAAINVAKIMAHNLRSELFIYRRNGEILRTRPL